MDKKNVAIFLKNPFKIWRLPDGAEEKLRSRFPDVSFKITESNEELKEILKDSEILLCWRFKEELLPLAKRLKWVHTALAGIEDFMYPEFMNSRIVLTNSSGVASNGIAEHVIGVVLCFSRKIFDSIQHQLKGKYERFKIWESESIPFEIEGKTVGILGYGSIGREIGSKCKALGMKVIALRRKKSESCEEKNEGRGERKGDADLIFHKDQLHELLKKSDFVVITLPLTPDTQGMIGEEELEQMKKDAYLINIARGEIVEEDALIKALNKGWIAGAALDVFEKEPLPQNHPFYSMPNVLITPHISGTNPEYMNRVVEIFSENLERFLKGKQLKNIINKKLGY